MKDMQLLKSDNRDASIDLLKVIAIFLIVNSHCADFFPERLKLFATGGAIGDALFFFASGYTLLLGKNNNASFINWYKRRINRIYPSIFAWAFLSSCYLTFTGMGEGKNMYELVFWGGGWFITCIMVYYIPFYFIKKNFLGYVYHLFALVSIAVIIWYCFVVEENYNIYATGSYFTRFAFFLFMLMGAICGYNSKKNNNGENSAKKEIVYIICLIVSLVFFNGIKLLLLKGTIPYYLSLTSMVMLFFVVFFFFKVCSSNWMRRIINLSFASS